MRDLLVIPPISLARGCFFWLTSMQGKCYILCYRWSQRWKIAVGRFNDKHTSLLFLILCSWFYSFQIHTKLLILHGAISKTSQMFLYVKPRIAATFSANYPTYFVSADLHGQYNFETMFSNKPLFKMLLCLCESIRYQYCSRMFVAILVQIMLRKINYFFFNHRNEPDEKFMKMVELFFQSWFK